VASSWFSLYSTAKVHLGIENNETARGLAIDIVCTLIQPFSCQDRGGRNVTTDISLRLLTLQIK